MRAMLTPLTAPLVNSNCAVPFREVDPTAYTELGEALERIAPVTAQEMN